MRKIFYLFIASLFFISLTGNAFAKNFFGKSSIIKETKAPTEPSKIQQQNPLPTGFDSAEEIYFKQRIDLSNLVSISDIDSSLKPRFFKLKLDNTKQYTLINLETMTELQTQKTSYTWKNLKSAYGYKFSFELIKYPSAYLFIKIEPFAKEEKDIPYTFVSFNTYQSDITIEAISYCDNPYTGFIKNILKVKK